MDHKLLKKFFAGECSPEEQVRIIAWYRSGEADNDLSEQIEAYWKNEEIQKAEDWGKDMLFERIMQNSRIRKHIGIESHFFLMRLPLPYY